MKDKLSLKRKSSSKTKRSDHNKKQKHKKKDRSCDDLGHSAKYLHKKSKKREDTSRHVDPILATEYDSSNSDSDLDIEKPLLPILDYINDRSELAHQLFRTLRGRKLNSMMPDILHRYSMLEVRDFCLRELEVMSKKRIGRILSGSKADDISSSSSEEEEGEETRNVVSVVNKVERDVEEKTFDDAEINKEEAPDSTCVLFSPATPESISPNGIGSYSKDASPNNQIISLSNEKINMDVKDEHISVTVKEDVSAVSKAEDVCVVTKKESTAVANDDVSMDRKKLEILELELRARAIRAMLKSQIKPADKSDS